MRVVVFELKKITNEIQIGAISKSHDITKLDAVQLFSSSACFTLKTCWWNELQDTKMFEQLENNVYVLANVASEVQLVFVSCVFISSTYLCSFVCVQVTFGFARATLDSTTEWNKSCKSTIRLSVKWLVESTTIVTQSTTILTTWRVNCWLNTWRQQWIVPTSLTPSTGNGGVTSSQESSDWLPTDRNSDLPLKKRVWSQFTLDASHFATRVLQKI